MQWPLLASQRQAKGLRPNGKIKWIEQNKQMQMVPVSTANDAMKWVRNNVTFLTFSLLFLSKMVPE